MALDWEAEELRRIQTEEARLDAILNDPTAGKVEKKLAEWVRVAERHLEAQRAILRDPEASEDEKAAAREALGRALTEKHMDPGLKAAKKAVRKIRRAKRS